MPASDDLRDGMGEAFDALSSEFQNGVVVKLCKVDPANDEFDDVLTIDDKRFFEYSAFRKQFILEIADNDAAITTAMDTATHVKIDSVYYVIAQGDTLPPSGVNPVWTIACELYEPRTQYAVIL